MEEKDLKQIKEVVREELKPFATKEDLEPLATKNDITRAFGEFWEANLEPAFDSIHERIDIVQTKLDKALYREFQRVDRLEKWAEEVGEKVGVKLGK